MTNSNDAPYQNKEVLREKYVHSDKAIDDICDELRCSRTTLYYWVDKHGLKEEKQALEDPKPWRDPNILRELYIEEDMSVFEVGDELGCSGSAVQRNLKKNGIETRNEGGYFSDAPHRQEDKLRELYVAQELSSREIAKEFDVSQKAVLDNLHKFNIETRASNREMPPTYYTRPNGYEYVMSAGKGVMVHALVAIANGADPEKALVDQDYVVHHKIPIPWLNTPDNLELISKKEHQQIHLGTEAP